MIDKMEKKRLAILRILQASEEPLPSSKITEELLERGYEISERTARFYLKAMDEEGLTKNLGKKGRRITQRGLEELSAARVIEKVGFLSAKIDQMTYRMNFDLSARQGTVVVNMSVMDPGRVHDNVEVIGRVFDAGYGMGRLMTLLGPGERAGDTIVPPGMVGLGTVCSITINGIMLQHGIPTHSRFGGLLEIHDHKPTRFVEIITYDGTSLDPLEIFIRSGMTDHLGVLNKGHGRVGASFREFPDASRDRVKNLARELEKTGLGAILKIGGPGQRLLEIPVGEGRMGAIVIGGLNPVAALEEMGVRVHSRALAGLLDFNRLFPYHELGTRLEKLL